MNDKIITAQLTFIQVYYYMPDYPSVINEFAWQTMDIYPRFPRTKRFLDFWSKNIDAKINQIYLGYTDPYFGSGYFKNITHEWSIVN
jgi:uncharacterized protein Usg